MKQIIMLFLTLFNITGIANAYNETNINPWTIDAAFGIASYPKTTTHDNQTAIARLSLGHALLTRPYWQMGIETSVQSGSSFRLNLPTESIDVLGGVPIEAKMNPFLDILISLKTEPLRGLPVVAWLKGGVAYRMLQVDRDEVNNVNEFSPEMQIGLSYRINEQATVNIGYQNILGKQPELSVNPQSETGVLQYIPAQQAVMIGFSFSVL